MNEIQAIGVGCVIGLLLSVLVIGRRLQALRDQVQEQSLRRRFLDAASRGPWLRS